jgi:hypothetical protein
MRNRLTPKLGLLALFFLATQTGHAALSVTYQGAAALAAALVGGGVSISNVTYTGASIAAGTFTGGTGIIGFNSGIILSSGDSAGVVGPNTSPGFSVCNATAGDADLTALAGGTATQDAAVLEFDFVPTSNQVSFNYVFASEEYPEFVGSFNDVFGFFVNGVNVALVPGTSTVVSINNVNCLSNSSYYINNNAPGFTGTCGLPYANLDTQMDGLTTVLAAKATVNPGVTNHIKLAIADAVDCAYDSDVFLQANSLVAPTDTFTPSPTSTKSSTGTPTLTATATPTTSPTWTATPSATDSPTSTQTLTWTSSPTSTDSPTASPTATPSDSPTDTSTVTPTDTPSATPTVTSTFTDSPTATPTSTDSPTPTDSPTFTDSPTITQTFTNSPTSTVTPVPLCLQSLANAPNPAALSNGVLGTNINYWLCTDATVAIRVYTVSGELVKDLEPFYSPSAGTYQQYWDLRNTGGNLVASGVFIYRITATTTRGETKTVFNKLAVVR